MILGSGRGRGLGPPKHDEKGSDGYERIIYVNKCQARAGTPMAEQSWLDVFELDVAFKAGIIL